MNSLPPFASTAKEGLLLLILAQPKGSRRKIVGVHEKSLKVSLNTPPVDGAANEALLDFLKMEWNLSSKEIELVSGHRSRTKILLLREGGVEKMLSWWKGFNQSM